MIEVLVEPSSENVCDRLRQVTAPPLASRIYTFSSHAEIAGLWYRNCLSLIIHVCVGACVWVLSPVRIETRLILTLIVEIVAVMPYHWRVILWMSLRLVVV